MVLSETDDIIKKLFLIEGELSGEHRQAQCCGSQLIEGHGGYPSRQLPLILPL